MSQHRQPAASSSPPTTRQKVPGRTLGFILMSLMILFAGFWMQAQQGQGEAPIPVVLQYDESISADFSPEAWFLPNEEMLGFVAIPAGTFTMGSNPALDAMAYENERWSPTRRQGTVELPTYFIARYEVTVAQYQSYVSAMAASNSSSNSSTSSADQPGNFPVSEVTWAEALAYSRWLDQRLRESSATPSAIRQLLENGGRVTIPSEAEWERAARGNDSRLFPWGSDPTSQYANFGGNAVARVGSKTCPPCSFGLADMSGNVWEFTRSPLQDYPFDAADDFDDLAANPIWVMRGGSAMESINNVRAAVRGGVDPGVRSSAIGFRLVISTL